MQRIAWLTDIHLNFAPRTSGVRVLGGVIPTELDGVFLSGDIAEAPTVADYLGQLEDACGCPIYFVLGNHDFYFGSIDRSADSGAACQDAPAASLLEFGTLACVGPYSAVVGHDGWADAREGDYLGVPRHDE
jgi:hypothetical protein